MIQIFAPLTVVGLGVLACCWPCLLSCCLTLPFPIPLLVVQMPGRKPRCDKKAHDYSDSDLSVEESAG